MTTQVEEPLIAVIGLGGVGSHCAHALVRAGVRRLRLVDFDRVSLSSLNRHAVGTRCDVGIPKVVACAAHFSAIAPDCFVDVCDEMFTAESAERLLGPKHNPVNNELEKPSVVVDCIDDMNTKVDLLSICVERGIHTLSALGSGAKGDPTQLCVARGLRDIENDPLATKLRSIFRTRGGDVSGISFVYSSEKPSRALLPLTDEQKAAPNEFGNVANFRLRVIPVLGTQPALAGIALAAQTLVELMPQAPFHPRPGPLPKRELAEKLLEQFRKREAARKENQCGLIDLTVGEGLFMLHEVWRGRSAFNSNLAISGASGLKFTFAAWDLCRPVTVGNVVLLTEAEADAHTGPATVEPELRKRVEGLLKWAESTLALRSTNVGTQATSNGEGANQQHCMNGNMNFVCHDSPSLLQRIRNSQDEEVLIAEQLSRSEKFLGAAGHERVRGAYVVVVGAGAVGSAAASLLLRAGVGHLRLVDGACVQTSSRHAVATRADVGLRKVDVCRDRLGAVQPHCQVEVVPYDFSQDNASDVLASVNSKLPDLVLDCTSGSMNKAAIVHEALSRGLRTVTAIAPRGLVDPTRVSVSALTDVYKSPIAVCLRFRLHALGSSSKINEVDAVHSQEDWQWATVPAEGTSPHEALMRLSIGVAAAAVALHRLAGEEAPRLSPSGMVGAWKKLDRGLRSRPQNGQPNLDLNAVGCIAEAIWRNRSALSRNAGTKGSLSGLCLTRWNRSQPCNLANVVLLTEEEAEIHDAATAETGSLPRDLLWALKDKGNSETYDEITKARLRIHHVLQQLGRYLVHDLTRPSCSQTPAQPMQRTMRSNTCTLTVNESKSNAISRFAPLVAFTTITTVALALGTRHLNWFGKRAWVFFLGGGLAAHMAIRPQWLRGDTQHPVASTSLVSPRIGLGLSGLVGRTPLIEIKSLSQATGCRIFAKAEFMNPGGCQKDRAAQQIVDDAEKQGLLRPGATIVEGTSGSTGISLSLVAASRGYRVHIVMPDDQAAEKVAMLRRFGAQVELVRPASITSPEHYVNVARRRAKEFNDQPGSVGAIFADQFENLSNFRAHYSGTGPELWEQCDRNLDAFVMSSGTGGTIAGVGSFLKSVSSKVQVHLADVPGSSLFNKVASGVLYASEQAEQTVRRHRTDTIAEGIGLDRLTANFAQGLCEHNGGKPIIDGAVRVTDQEALDMAHYVLAHEGIFIGSSAAVNCVGAVKVARQLGRGHVVATVLCDNGNRHITKFFNPEVWPDFGLVPPAERARDDLSFVS